MSLFRKQTRRRRLVIRHIKHKIRPTHKKKKALRSKYKLNNNCEDRLTHRKTDERIDGL